MVLRNSFLEWRKEHIFKNLKTDTQNTKLKMNSKLKTQNWNIKRTPPKVLRTTLETLKIHFVKTLLQNFMTEKDVVMHVQWISTLLDTLNYAHCHLHLFTKKYYTQRSANMNTNTKVDMDMDTISNENNKNTEKVLKILGKIHQSNIKIPLNP